MNVKPSARPQDLYAEVANLVEKRRNADAAEGIEIAQKLEGNQFVGTLLYCNIYNISRAII